MERGRCHSAGSQIYRIPEWFKALREDDASHGRDRVSRTIDTWRKRLVDISWFMRSVNEPLARWANREDNCKGRFWEGRFHSLALLDDEAVLQCLVYVDLNPIRAGIADTPEESEYASIKARIEGRDAALAPMAMNDGSLLPLTREDYLALVDWSGRQWRSGKRGLIDPDLPPILERLVHAPDQWLENLRHLMSRYRRAIGTRKSLFLYRAHLRQTRLHGLVGLPV